MRGLVLALLLALVACSGRTSRPIGLPTEPPPLDTGMTAEIIIGQVTGLRVPQRFVGLSVEPFEIRRLLQGPAGRLNGQLLRRLAHGGRSFLRIGGGTTDETYWAPAGPAPVGAWVALDSGWLAVVAGFAEEYDVDVQLGVNLAAGDPSSAAALAAAGRAALGDHLVGLELGNEPDGWQSHLYRHNAPAGATTRGPGWNVVQYVHTWDRTAAAVAAATPDVPLVGPASNRPEWAAALVKAVRPPALVALHAYPLARCGLSQRDPAAPNADRLLSAGAGPGFAAAVAARVVATSSGTRPVLLDEVNSIACGGVPGVSDGLPAALWGADIPFQLLDSGLAGTAFHENSGTSYSPVAVSSDGSRAEYRGLAYGLVAYADAAPPGADVLDTVVVGSDLRAHATRSSDGVIHLLVVNTQSTSRAVRMQALDGQEASLARLGADDAGRLTYGGSSTLQDGHTDTGRPVDIRHLVLSVPARSAVVLRLV